MNKREIEEAIEAEVAEWPGVTVEFVSGGKHPKAKLTFAPPGGDPLMLSRPYAGTPGTQAIRPVLGDIRRVMKQLGATRAKPEPSADEDEARYSKPNPGRGMRPDPVEREPVAEKPDLADKMVQAGAATPEQAEKAREEKPRAPLIVWDDKRPAVAVVGEDDAGEPDEDRAAAIERIKAAVATIEDGIYFDLPEEVYHAIPRLSASGLQNLLISPGTFWKRSWLNPEKEEELDEDATKAQILGKAYHCARLEPDRFEQRFCRKPRRNDYPAKGLLTSDAAVKAELKARGETQTIGTETIPERCQRLLDIGFEGTIWPLVMAEWEGEVGGRTPIEGDKWDEIVRDMDRLRASADIAELLSGGQAEVSIFWTDRYGLKMKARLDYLAQARWDDLKTFDNSRGKVLAQALADALRYNRYHVQAVTYRDAVEAIRLGGLQIKGEANDAQRTLIAAIQIAPDELACWYIFQEKGGVPNLLAKEFPFYTVPLSTRLNNAITDDVAAIARVEASTRVKSGLHIRAIQDIDKAKRDFMLYAEVYEPGTPWSPIEPVSSFSDLDFNSRWLEGQYD